MFIFEKLLVYQRSVKLSIQLIRIAESFPIKYSRIRDQLIGATVSIPLNIAEGQGRTTQKEKNQFFRIARGSAYELVPILEICEGLELLDKKLWINEIEEISKILSSLIKN